MAQLTPLQTYYGVNRPVRVSVQVPAAPMPAAPMPAEQPVRAPDGSVVDSAGSAGAGGASLELIDVGPLWTLPDAGEAGVRRGATGEKRTRVGVQAGEVDLAQLFPTLWADPHNAGVRMRFVQLLVGEVPVGPALVLQPMTTPARAALVHPSKKSVWYVEPATQQSNFDAREGQVVWQVPVGASASLLSGLRVYVEQHVLLTTSVGELEVRLVPQAAPNSVWNFRELVRGGFYSDIAFHRIVARTPKGDPFVVQVGDPTASGEGGPGFDIALEPSPLPHDFGVLSMARDNDPDTNGSQFFICLSREGTQALDGKYTSFGEVVRGLPTLLALEQTRVRDQRPLDPPVLQSATLIDAPPRSAGARPLPRIQRPVETKPKTR
jgi:cyclophilin family peptidyl-prolyl cis-trans isomerase